MNLAIIPQRIWAVFFLICRILPGSGFSNNGEQIRLSIPPLTEERRKELVKQIRNEAETARISLRNARRDAVEAFKKAQKEGMPEDESKDGEAQAQKLLEKFTKTLDEALQKKEKEIMTV